MSNVRLEQDQHMIKIRSKALSRQDQDKTKARLRQDQGKIKTRARS